MSATAGASTVGALGAGGVFSAKIAGASLLKIAGGNLLSGLLTGASAFSSIQAGNMQMDILNAQARQADLNARMETLKGKQQALTIRKQLDKDLASMNATFAARGVLAGEGTAAAAEEESRRNAEEDINIARFGAEMGAESDRMQAQQYRMEAGAARSAGVTNALNTITNSRSVRNLSTSLIG
jgi:hypothetical protein